MSSSSSAFARLLRAQGPRLALGLAAAGAALPLARPDAALESGGWRWPVPRSAPLLPRRALAGEYELQGVIGEGGFAQVLAGRHRASSERVAIKRVAKARTSRAQFLREVDMLRRARGAPGVPALREAFETREAFVLVTELVRGGELFDRLVRRGAFEEAEARALALELARALAHLHAQAVVHADLKPENILLTAERADGGCEPRIVDFGQAFRADQQPDLVAGDAVYTLAYAPPERLGAAAGPAGRAVDVWALGVVLYIVLCGHHPFDPADDATDEQLAARIRAGAVDREAAGWKRLSAGARELIDAMLSVDPALRPTAEQVLAHSWTQQLAVEA